MNDIAISVIIPAYNIEQFLGEAIESVLNQTQLPAEIIVVDDGSTDGTARIAKSFGDRVRYLHQRNSGVVEARMSGIQAARNDWIAFLDSDDVWYPQKLELQLQTLRSLNGPALLCSDRLAFVGGSVPPQPTIGRQPPQRLSTELILQRNTIATSTVLMPKCWFDEIGGLETRYKHAEDLASWLRIASLDKPMWWMPQQLIAYRMRVDSLSDRPTKMLRDIELRIIRDFVTEHRGAVSWKTLREANADAHYRAGMEYGAKHQFRDVLRESVQSVWAWPLTLHLYARGTQFLRLRMTFRAVINLLRISKTGVGPELVPRSTTDGGLPAMGPHLVDPLVSVIIPSYNYGRYLREAVDSALQQTVKQIEILVIDDGSTDDTPEVVLAYKNNPRVHYVQQENRGLSASRNVGIRLARGEFIALLDADDRWKPEKLERQLRRFTSDDVGLVFSGRTTFNEEGETNDIPARSEDCDRLLERLTVSTVFSPSAAIIRKRCFLECGGFDENLRKVEDREMWIRIAQRYLFRCVEDCLVEFRVHDKALNRQIEGMEEAFRITLQRAFALAPLNHRFLLSQRAHAFMHYDFSWVYFTAGQKRLALKHLLLSLAYYPVPDLTGRFFGQRFARYRRLLRYLLFSTAD